MKMTEEEGFIRLEFEYHELHNMLISLDGEIEKVMKGKDSIFGKFVQGMKYSDMTYLLIKFWLSLKEEQILMDHAD